MWRCVRCKVRASRLLAAIAADTAVLPIMLSSFIQFLPQVLPTQLVPKNEGKILRALQPLITAADFCCACLSACFHQQVLPTQLVPDDEGKILRVRLIQKEGKKLFDPVYLFDEGSTISWIPCGRKLTCSFPGIKFYYGPDTW
jgi:hypothetical protein